MKAIAYQQALPITDSKALEDITLPDPVASGHDLLVEVRAVSVNPVDTKVRKSTPAPAGEWKVPGWDAAGVVLAVGPEAQGFKVGERVWYAGSITRPGSNSERHLVDARIVGKMPVKLGFAEAAAMPLTTITAWELLFDRFQIAKKTATQPGGTGSLLIIGAAGGVGSIMVQLARQLTNLKVIGTASRPETKAWVSKLGAHHVIDHSQSLIQELKRIGIPEVQYAASLTHTDKHFPEIAESIAPQGKFGLLDDAPPGSINIALLKPKCISLHWEMMFTRSRFTTPDIAAQGQLLNEVAGLIDAGHIQHTVGEHFGVINASNLKRAHAAIESGKTRGKIVLEGF